MEDVVAHATLGTSPGATPDEIRAAYRRRAFETHPDRSAGSAAAFQAVAEAYRVLCGAAERAGDEAGGAGARVPGMDAAKVLFEYLSDLASEMILNGATPDAVVAFLAGEGCPETVARALEQDLRARVRPPGPELPAGAPQRAGPQDQGEARVRAAPPGEVGPAPARRPGRRRSVARRVALGVAAAAVGACVLVAWRSAGAVRASEPPRSAAPFTAPSPPSPPAQPPPARFAVTPPRKSPIRPGGEHAAAQRSSARAGEPESLRAWSAEIDGERSSLEAARARLAAEAGKLEAERREIDAAQTAFGAQGDRAELSSLRARQAAYNERLEAARRTERALQRRTDALNARIVAYNARVRTASRR